MDIKIILLIGKKKVKNMLINAGHYIKNGTKKTDIKKEVLGIMPINYCGNIYIMSVNGRWKHTESNDWNTPKRVWDKVIPFMDREKTYWLPFYNDGYAGKYLTEKGFKVIHKNEDFFNTMYDDVVVVDNPPYKVKCIVKIKKRIMDRLIEHNIPFMLLY